MYLAYVLNPERGAADLLLAGFADRLLGAGVPLAGVVQYNSGGAAEGCVCDMDLRLLPDGGVIRISQSLGAGSSGCRLDTSALEGAVGAVEPLLDRAPALLMINKFGKHEAEGRGFRPLIGEALGRGIPVLLGVNDSNLPGFLAFAGDLAEELEHDPAALDAWFARVHSADATAA